MLSVSSAVLSFNAAAPSVSAVSRSAVRPVMQQAVGIQQGTYGGVVPTRGAVGSADGTILVQGGSLRTWSYRSPAVEQVPTPPPPTPPPPMPPPPPKKKCPLEFL